MFRNFSFQAAFHKFYSFLCQCIVPLLKDIRTLLKGFLLHEERWTRQTKSVWDFICLIHFPFFKILNCGILLRFLLLFLFFTEKDAKIFCINVRSPIDVLEVLKTLEVGRLNFQIISFFYNFSNRDIPIERLNLFERIQKFTDVAGILVQEKLFRQSTDNRDGKFDESDSSHRNDNIPDILAHFDGEAIDVVGCEPFEDPEAVINLHTLIQMWV